MEFDDIGKARENIEKLFRLRDDLIEGSPYLNDMKARLDWYEKAATQIPEDADKFYSLLETPVQRVLSMSPMNLDFGSLTGATGSFYSVTADTRQIITDHGPDHYTLIEEYDELKKTEELIEEIIEILARMRPELKRFKPDEILEETKIAYEMWKAETMDNSDLAKDARAFQDIFKGCLRDAWATAANTKPSGFSWNKMAAVLGSDGGSKKSLLSVKGAEEQFHDDFSMILKKTKTVSEEEMDRIFKSYIEHLYSVINFVDQRLMR